MKKIISLVAILFLANIVCFAQVKSFKVEATEDVPSNKSQDEVVAGLMKSLTNQAIEKAEINLKDYKLSDKEYDEFIKAVPKIEIKNKKIFMKKNSQQCVNMKLNVKIDPEVANAYLEKVKKDKETKMKEMDTKIRQEMVNVNVSTVSATVINTSSTTAANSANVVVSSDTVSKISINEAVKEANQTKQEVNKLLDNFDNSLKESNNEISKNYEAKISKINTNIKKDQWETTQQYKIRLEKNKKEQKKLEKEKELSINDNKIKIAKLATTTISPLIEKLKSFQSETYYDDGNTNAQIVSLGEVNADEKYFIIKILFEDEQSIISNLIYDFSDIDIEQAKSMYQTPNQFVISPLFSVSEDSDGNAQKVLTAFNVKHLGIVKEKIIKLAATVKQFSEIKKFDFYNNLVNKK